MLGVVEVFAAIGFNSGNFVGYSLSRVKQSIRIGRPVIADGPVSGITKPPIRLSIQPTLSIAIWGGGDVVVSP
jgi:hypothetical protein